MKVLLAVFALLALASATPVQECPGTTVGDLIRVEVEGCDSPPCTLIKGETVNFQIEFNAGGSSASLEPEVWGIIGGIPVPFGGVPENACESLIEGRCPFADGDHLVYSEGMEVLAIYPSIELTVRWALTDESRNWQVCFELDVEIVDFKKKPRLPGKFLF